MKKIFFLLLLSAPVFAGDLKYPVSQIPEELIKNVNAVIREEEWRFTILARDHARHYVHEVVTIFNEQGNNFAHKAVSYDKHIKVIDINAYVYDASGKQIKRLKNKDIVDRSYVDFGTLFSDDRLKIFDLSQAVYPYTVEYDYEVEYKYLFFIPSESWGGEKLSHEHASYELIYPIALKPRYKLMNSDVQPIHTTLDGGKESVKWSFSNLKPTDLEPSGPPAKEIIPTLIAAPSDFQFEEYAGNLDTWQNYGKWIGSLNAGRGVLPDQTKQVAREIAAKYQTTEEKVKALYEYMQGKTRYVGIQLGIGGWQPFEASVVDKNGYGDCKALSNYMISLLREVGIPANYVLITAGPNANMDSSFPRNQFNHAIAAVPNGKDTLWLECTSQTNPFGYQGTFTGDRSAFMITPDGGKPVKTIAYKPEQNLQSRKAIVSIDAAGNGKAIVQTVNTGLQYEKDDLDRTFSDADAQRKWIQDHTDIPNFVLNKFSIKEKKDKIPAATVDLDLTLNRYASVSGKRLFITPNLMNRLNYVPEKVENRKFDVIRRLNYIHTDTVQISVPENLYPEFIPEPVKLRSRFGEYDASVKFEAGKVTYIRRMKIWKGRFPKETYNEFVDFYKNITKADNLKLVFLNKT